MKEWFSGQEQTTVPCRAPISETRSAMLLAQLSHEIRAPLTGIRVLMQGAQAGHMSSHWAQEVEQSVQYLLNLSDNYLQMVRAETLSEAITNEAFDLATVVQESLYLVKHLAQEKQLRLVVDWGSVNLRLAGNPLPIKQILINLLSNGIKFTQTGHVHVAANASATLPGDATLTLFVSDTGPGLGGQAGGSSSALAFEPFVRLHEGDAGPAHGFGLGLAIVKKLAQASGGGVTAMDLPQGGLCVSVSLKMPCVRLPPPALGQVALSRPCWILDAYAPAAESLARNLQAIGVRHVHCVPAAQGGRPPAGLHADDMVICDESMLVPASPWLSEVMRRPAKVHVALMSDARTAWASELCHVARLGTPWQWAKPLGLLEPDSPSEEAQPAACRELPEEHRGKTFLLVDDSRVNQIIVGEYFRSIGLEVVVAENGVEALAVLAQQSVDLVLTDLSMPVLDGPGMVREIRRLGLHVPVVALTGSIEPEMRASCRHAGMAAYLTKPLEVDQALAQLVAVLDEQGHTNITRARA